MKYRLTGPAKEDLWEVWRYLVEQASLDIADRVVSELHEAMEKLAERPQSGHLRTDLAGEALRFWRVHSYLVVYLPESTPLHYDPVVFSRFRGDGPAGRRGPGGHP